MKDQWKGGPCAWMNANMEKSNCFNAPKNSSKRNIIFGGGGWRLIGRFVAFRPKGRGFESSSSRQIGTFCKSFLHSQLPMGLRREILTQHPCCVGSASE